MKTKIVVLVLASCLLVLAAWLVHAPNPAQADDVPEKYRDTVNKGLEYLVKNQHKDGHWEGDGGQHPVAMTGLVGLALLMERDGERPWRSMTPRPNAKYAAEIRKAADWLIDKSQPKRDGLIFSEHSSETARYMQGQGLATLFLAGVFQGEQDAARQKKLTDVLARALKYIVKAQSSQGGWHDTSRMEGHDFATVAATAIQIQALQAAENVGVPVPNGTISAAQGYLKMALGKYDETAKPGQNRRRQTDTAAALACRPNYTGVLLKDELREKWFKYCQTEIPVGRDTQFGRDELAHYYYAQAVYNLGGDGWTTYRTAMFDRLQSSQNRDGSWPAGEGVGVGPVYATAVWCTVLQLDKDSHPSRQRIMESN